MERAGPRKGGLAVVPCSPDLCSRRDLDNYTTMRWVLREKEVTVAQNGQLAQHGGWKSGKTCWRRQWLS